MYKSYDIRAEAQRVEEARMNKLTYIKNRLKFMKIDVQENKNHVVTTESVIESVEYLLSHLEEKDKALAFYADKKNYDTVYENDDDPFSLMSEKVLVDGGTIARTALNTTKEEDQ